MANSARIVHSKVARATTGADAQRVYGTDWNADHVLTGLESVDNTSDATKNAAIATLTNKTIDTAGPNTILINGNALAAAAGTATVTVPNSTDTLVGRDTTDTLANKTLTSPSITGATITTSTYNGNIWTAGTGTLTLGAGKTATISNTLTFTGTDASSIAFGSGGTVAYQGSSLAQFAATTSAQLAGVISDETGTGALVFATSPTLVTPTLGAASATSINKVAITAPLTGSTITIADGATLTAPATASVSGTNTGDQTITLTGDVTGSGTGSFATTIGATKVTSAMLNADVFSTAHTWSGVQTFTNPVVGTQTVGDNSTKAASTAFVQGAVAAINAPEPTFKTITDAQSATLAAADVNLRTLGNSSLNDGGGMTMEVLSSNPGAGQVFALAGGKYGRNIERVLRPEQFGCKFDGSNDQHQGLIDLATELRRRGGGRVEFPDYKDLKIWDSNPSAGSDLILMDLSGARGVRINFNGSRLLSSANWGGVTSTGRLIYAVGVRDLTVDDFHYEQTFYKTLQDQYGGVCFDFYNECVGVVLDGVYVDGSRDGVAVSRTTGFSNSNRAREIFMFGGDFNNIYYPLNCRRNGDQLEAVYRTNLVGRSYFPYNVKQHKISVESNHGGPYNDCLLKVYADSTEVDQYNTLSQIDLDYVFRQKSTNTAAQSHIEIEFQQNDSTSTPGFIYDVDIKVDIESDQTNGPIQGIGVSKYDVSGAADTTTRGHELDATISGKMTGYNNGVKAGDMFTGTWTGETANVTLSKLQVKGSSTSFDINCSPISRTLLVDRCQMDKNLNLTNVQQNTVDLRNTRTANLNSFGSNANGSWRFLHDGMLECFGIITANTNALTPVTFPLAFAAVPVVNLNNNQQTDTAPTNAYSITATGFIINKNGNALTGSVQWRAIGRAF